MYIIGDRITSKGEEFEILAPCPHHRQCWWVQKVDDQTFSHTASLLIDPVFTNPNFPETTHEIVSLSGKKRTVRVKYREGDYLVHEPISKVKGVVITHSPTSILMTSEGTTITRAKKIVKEFPQGLKTKEDLRSHLAELTEVINRYA